jgi:hypothetical protein
VRRLNLLDLCGWAVRRALLMLLAAVVLAAVALRHGICAARGEQ